MGAASFLVLTAAFLLASISLSSAGYGKPGGQCYHVPEKPTVGVHLPGSDRSLRNKRQTNLYQPIRIFLYYDDTINTELDATQRNRLQNVVMPAAQEFLQSALSVIPVSDVILLDRSCNGSFFLPIGDVVECVDFCQDQTTCGTVVIPENHLKRCVECGGSSANCDTRPGSEDGEGVADSDLIIYISTSLAGGICAPGTGVIAFASACELESTLDRPISGYINFCPALFGSLSDSENIEVALHELTHALGFSAGLYAFYRDENGNPRTPRDEFGFPPFNPTAGRYEPSTDTVNTITYDDWLTRTGVISREVDMLVTPNIIEQAQIQFGCEDIIGVELENQGGSGTAFSHWEHRVLGNEAMTGTLLFNGPFSRITFGLFEDTGWYLPNYDVAQELAWGRNRGCSIPHGSCAEYIQNQQASQCTLSPFCDALQSVEPPVRTCSVDRELFARCNLDTQNEDVPSEFQYFNSGANFGPDIAPNVSGTFTPMDYCPFESPFSIDFFSSPCSDPFGTPNMNTAGETYGTGSRCIEHGQTWTTSADGQTLTNTNGVGCYQYFCSPSGVEIHLLGLRYLCSCEGEELLINTTIDGTLYQGSFICPSCLSLCYDQLTNCPDPEPDACPGQQTMAEPLPVEPIEIEVERDVYSIIEGSELLEVCVVIVSGVVTSEIEIVGHSYNSFASLWVNIRVEPGDNRSCVDISFTDNECLDKRDRKFELLFYVNSALNTTSIVFDDYTAWIYLVDDEIVQIGLQQELYKVVENASDVSVCVQLLEGSPCFRPVNARLYTMDGSAIAGEDYKRSLAIVSIPAGSEAGSVYCTSIGIIDNFYVEESEYFTVHLEVEDLNIKIPPNAFAWATVEIKDDDVFAIQFSEDTPFVDGDSVTLTFISSVPLDEATCSVTRFDSVDCISGSATFQPFPATRRRAYTGTITATAGGETLTLERRFRSETTGSVCGVHLINEDFSISGQTAIVQVQGTGPTAALRISDFECRFDDGNYTPCGTNPIEVSIPPGSLELSIRPRDDGNICELRRALRLNLT